MIEDKSTKGNKRKKDHILRETIVNDFKRGEIGESLRRDFKELYRFYIDAETQNRLESYPRVKRFIFASWYLLKSLILRLNPAPPVPPSPQHNFLFLGQRQLERQQL